MIEYNIVDKSYKGLMMNIIDINKNKPNDIEKELEKLKKNLPTIIEIAEIQAKMVRISYESYLKEGFTKTQALELCKKT